MRAYSVVGLLALAGAAVAITPVGKDGTPSGPTKAAPAAPIPAAAPAGVPTSTPPAGLPSAADYSSTVLPELKGVVPWRVLAQVTPVKENGRMVPTFSKEILALDRKEGRFQGFMLPLDMGEKQARFILAAVPPHCSFCLPAGPDAMIEVIAKTPIRYGFEPIVVAGKFTILKDDPSGVIYRLTDAVALSAAPIR